jgi:hypothetical protein
MKPCSANWFLAEKRRIQWQEEVTPPPTHTLDGIVLPPSLGPQSFIRLKRLHHKKACIFLIATDEQLGHRDMPNSKERENMEYTLL